MAAVVPQAKSQGAIHAGSSTAWLWRLLRDLLTLLAALTAAVVLLQPSRPLNATLRLAPEPAGPPLCDQSHLDGILDVAEVSWKSWLNKYKDVNESSRPPWYPPYLELSRCKLRRFTPDQARQCLAGRPLIMIGDSVTRYQYLSLIYYLEFGEWPPPLMGTKEKPSPLWEGNGWGDWNRFFQGTTAPFGEHQQCRCYRVGMQDMREDRFYQNGNVSAIHYMWMGYPRQPLVGLWGFPPFSNATRPCEPGKCSNKPEWSMPMDVAMKEVLARFKPHTIVLNSGIWRSREGNRNAYNWEPRFFESLMRAANDAVAPQDGRCIWKMTTADSLNLRGHDWDAVSLFYAAKHRWAVMDGWALTEALKHAPNLANAWVDKVHFRGFPYTELNQVLLNMICPN